MAGVVLPWPTADDVIKAEKKFDEENGPIEWVLTQLFQKFPKNIDFGEVVVKTKVLNILYSTQIRAVNKVAKHICSLEIDTELKAGKVEIVDQIANVQLEDKTIHFPWRTRFTTATLKPVFGTTKNKEDVLPTL